ncbi:MAG: membrane protein insertase YidC [Flavobacteriaceae bacterium]
MEENKFDKNSIIGFLLIGAILLYYMYTNQPEVDPTSNTTNTEQIAAPTENTVPALTLQPAEVTDSAATQEALQAKYGVFAPVTQEAGHSEKTTVVANDKLKLTFSNKGGYLVQAELLNYDTYDGKPVYLINDGNADFNLSFTSTDARSYNTRDLYFTPEVTKSGTSTFVKMNLQVSATQFISYVYELKADDFMLGFSIKSQGMDGLINASNGVELSLNLDGLRQEKSIKYENQQSALYYQVNGDEIDDLSIAGDDDSQETNINWVGFKQHFFSTILIAKEPFKSGDLKSTSLFKDEETDSIYTKAFAFTAPLELKAGNLNADFDYYIGPNDYELLKSYDLGIENVIDLGWGIFGTINRWAFIPLFNFLSNHMTNFGLIIILMTIIVRIFMSPLVYKSYVSSAKMKILKPEMNAVNEKYPGKDNAMKRQQETMAIQKKAGVSMLSGCIPALLQMPVFFALFRFFPSAIGLRGEGFLWADDLSSYDSVYQLPFNIPFYGDHISLFPILASIAIFFYMKMNQSQQMNMQQPAQEGMPDMQAMMKYMIYLSPLMMLFFFNNYASGLSLYYFVSNLLTITIMLVIKNVIIDEKKLHAQIEENKKKPVKQSKFRQRLDEAMKQAQEQQAQQKKK